LRCFNLTEIRYTRIANYPTSADNVRAYSPVKSLVNTKPRLDSGTPYYRRPG